MIIKNISEKKLKKIIREALLTELEDFGVGSRMRKATYGKCDIVIPDSLKAILLPGQSVAQFKQKYPYDDASFSKTVHAQLPIIIKYGNVGLNLLGFGTLQCTLLGTALELFGNLLTKLGYTEEGEAARKEGTRSGNLSLSFDSEIKLAAEQNISGNQDIFYSVYPFYVFPTLANKGKNSRDMQALNDDIAVYKSGYIPFFIRNYIR